MIVTVTTIQEIKQHLNKPQLTINPRPRFYRKKLRHVFKPSTNKLLHEPSLGDASDKHIKMKMACEIQEKILL